MVQAINSILLLFSCGIAGESFVGKNVRILKHSGLFFFNRLNKYAHFNKMKEVFYHNWLSLLILDCETKSDSLKLVPMCCFTPRLTAHFSIWTLWTRSISSGHKPAAPLIRGARWFVLVLVVPYLCNTRQTAYIGSTNANEFSRTHDRESQMLICDQSFG